MKNTKSKILIVRVESPFKDAISACAERGKFGSQSNLVRTSLEEQFEKFLTTEERESLVNTEKR